MQIEKVFGNHDLALRAKGKRPFPKTVEVCAKQIAERTGGLPYMVGGVPCVPRWGAVESSEVPVEGYLWRLKTEKEFEVWLKKIRFEMVPSVWEGEEDDAMRKRDAVGVLELYYECQNQALGDEKRNFHSIGHVPHYPRMSKVLYVERKEGRRIHDGGEYLDEFLSFFSPETEIDRELMRAMCLTLVAGLEPGTRPAFVITTEGGRRGFGKTSAANAIARLVGGAVESRANENGQRRVERLLSPEGMERRVVLIDNLKEKLSSDQIEALITTPRVQGHQLYVGQTGRMNDMVWVVTANTPKFSVDLAQRGVVVKIGKPRREAGWHRKLRLWVEENRWNLIDEMVEVLRVTDRRMTLEGPQVVAQTRFPEWEELVLGSCRMVEECQKEIVKRAGGVMDSEGNWAELRVEVEKRMGKGEGAAYVTRATLWRFYEKVMEGEKLAKEDWEEGLKDVVGQTMGPLEDWDLVRHPKWGDCVKLGGEGKPHRCLRWSRQEGFVVREG